jgi:hypothetical protein
MRGMPAGLQPSPDAALNRVRYLYVIAMAAVIATGLWWRSAYNPASPFWYKYGGDTLWALLMFLGFRCVLIRASILRVTLVSLTFCFAVEYSQLYHAPWIDSIRATRLGTLALGSTFNAPDLIAYAIGVACGSVIEMIRPRSGCKPAM